ncbi:MAG: glycosyltransferase [Kiritimatiellae bacterium]|nr:glycosyltransferase [Kiritimatiellia bacterium]
MPRVLQVIEATIGGTRRHVRELSLGLAETDWQVDVAYAIGRDPGFRHDLELFRQHAIGVHAVPMRRRPAPVEDLRAVTRLTALIRRLRPDVVHAHSSKAGLLARLAARRAGVPVVYTPHLFAFEMQVAKPLRALYRAIERLAVPWCDRLIAVSRAEADAARTIGYPADKVALIHNGVPPLPLPPRDRGELHDVAFVGRFCRQKGLDVLMAALPLLRRQCPGLTVAIMGDGIPPWRPRPQPGIAWLSAGDAQAVIALLRGSRLLAMPSRWEGLPYTLLEAMQAGTPVVASRVGGVSDVITHEVDGWLVPPDDPRALAQALLTLLEDEIQRALLAETARQRVADFTLEAMIEATRRVYRDVLA